ncbi:MAG: hypothetical protein PHO03_05730 [Candidatus Omnitrophica bacterium]|nr:hypothetical protein [Candidatus Omnitrophota bacterium]
MRLIWQWLVDNWPSLLVGSIIIPALFILISYFWHNYVSVLKITPEVKNINCSNTSWRKETFYVYLTNNSSNPIYDINVIAHHPEEVDVNLYLEEEHQEAVAVGKISVGTAYSIHQSKVTQTYINNIAPKKTVKLKVEVNTKSYLNNFELRTKVKSFSKTPKPIFTVR